MAVNVERTADSPALIKGSGTPITGKNPSAIPAFINIWNVIANTMDIITRTPALSEASRAPAIIRESSSA